jgi:hypothetical protein
MLWSGSMPAAATATQREADETRQHVSFPSTIINKQEEGQPVGIRSELLAVSGFWLFS